jgi:hypothetical protein
MSHTARTVDTLLIRPTHGDQTGAGDNERTDHWEGIQTGAGPQTSHARHHQHQACRSDQPNRRTTASQSATLSRDCSALQFQIRQYQAVSWIRRGARSPDEEQSPIPLGVSQLEAARRVVAALLADPPEALDAEIGGVEVVQLCSGHGPSTMTHGVAMQWRQGRQEFGLLMPIERLAHQAGGLDSVPFYLGLAVDEPHDQFPEGPRTWFTDLPSGPY